MNLSPKVIIKKFLLSVENNAHLLDVPKRTRAGSIDPPRETAINKEMENEAMHDEQKKIRIANNPGSRSAPIQRRVFGGRVF